MTTDFKSKALLTLFASQEVLNSHSTLSFVARQANLSESMKFPPVTLTTLQWLFVLRLHDISFLSGRIVGGSFFLTEQSTDAKLLSHIHVAFTQVPCPLHRLGHKILSKSVGGSSVPFLVELAFQNVRSSSKASRTATCSAFMEDFVYLSVSDV